MVRDTLSQAGFVVHPTKSIWEPTQWLTWLGFVIDLSMGQIEVPDSEQKLEVLEHRLQHACQSPSLHAKLLASVVGRIISMGLAVGPISQFMMRSLYTVLEMRQSWCDRLILKGHGHNVFRILA